MVHIPRLLASDEELGKRDDDHKPGKGYATALWRSPMRYRKRRVVTAVVVGLCIWLFINYMPADSKGLRRRHQDGSAYSAGQSTDGPVEPSGPPPRGSDDLGPEAGSLYYNGVIRFWRLAPSLHGISRTMGYRPVNRNVLFVASNLKSASVLIPMACEMARWDRNYVHLAFVGRENIPIDDILEINGVNKETCAAFWHDARPDNSEYSTELRAESSVAAAMNHVDTFMHPQAIIIDDCTQEDAFFVRAIRSKARELDRTVIELPHDITGRFTWMTRLESGSLKAWHKATVDILVQAPAESSGSLIRLVKSLQGADYAGFTPPRLTIELPLEIDPPTKHLLGQVVWPPNQDRSLTQINELILRHRIRNQRGSAEETSVRFLESFYPASPGDSHILLLSPQAQLSPSYYHYLKYHLLEYKYSDYGAMTAGKLLGISLEPPSTHLNGSSPFVPPTVDSMSHSKYKSAAADATALFLWQAPNSNAALYFGDKWIELHSFLSNRLTVQRSKSQPRSRPKLISQTFPAWTEYFLELMRARGYSLMYPGSLPDALVTVHNELYQPPEEFGQSRPSIADDKIKPPPLPTDEPFLTSATALMPPHNLELSLAPASLPLHVLLPFSGDLPELTRLPQLDYAGNIIDSPMALYLADGAAAAFRSEVGGCTEDPKGRRRKVASGSARDLFCFGDEGDEYVDETDYEESSEFDEPLAALDAQSRSLATATQTRADRTEIGTEAASPAANTALEALESRRAAVNAAQAAIAHGPVEPPAAADGSTTAAATLAAEITDAAAAPTPSVVNTAIEALESRLAVRASAIAARKAEEARDEETMQGV